MKYLINIYIVDFRERFVKTFISQILHFDIINISRDEDDHAILKRQLDVSIEDLKTMIKSIDLLLMNEYINHTFVIENAKIRYFLKMKKSVYQLISLYVIHVVIRKIHCQYELLTKNSTIMFVCIEVFIIITNLSCSHLIQKRLYEDEFLMIKDVHSH
jgi:hypothetical protein